MAPRTVVAAIAAAVLLGAAAPAALGQDEGVTVDPSSPSGREYALPVDSARQDGGAKRDRGTPSPSTSTTRQDGAEADGDAPLFGVGIGDDGAPDGSAGARTTKRAPKHPAKTTTTATTPAATTPVEATRTTTVAAAAAPSDGGGGGGGGTLALIVVGVLGVGALAGVGLRRARRHGPAGA
jgi:hypothetical protein